MLNRHDTHAIEMKLRRLVKVTLEKKQENAEDFLKTIYAYIKSEDLRVREEMKPVYEMYSDRFAFDSGRSLLSDSNETIYLEFFVNNINLDYNSDFKVQLFDEDFTDTDMRQSMSKYYSEVETLNKELKMSLRVIEFVSAKYGSLRYMLTQVPELIKLCTEREQIEMTTWKPNKNYKVFSRDDVIKECDPTAITALLGAAVLEGVDVNGLYHN